MDATEKVHDGGAPGVLRDLLGIEVDEQWPIADGLTERDRLRRRALSCVPSWSEWLERRRRCRGARARTPAGSWTAVPP
ncbi:MAG: hypothetical protein P0Y60_03165 [Candidatus Microbacterium colombiense]|nr:MAG: hypothetical protein P0Y60_03165 [Microbacterium sp.]